MKRFLLPRFCRPIGIALWVVALVWGFTMIYDWVYTTPEWAHALLGPRLTEEGFEFPTWSRLIYDHVQTEAPDGKMKWYGSSAAYDFNPLLMLALTIGAALIFCSREKVEDEMTLQERMRSLMIAFCTDIALFIISYICVLLPHGMPNFLVQTVSNNFAIFMIILPVVHLLRRWLSTRELKEEIIL